MMRLKGRRGILLTLLLALVAFGMQASFAQTSKGVISGVVSDKSGAVLSGATVTAISLDSGETRTVKTNTNGSFRIEAINPGIYKLVVTASGFAKLELSNLDVRGSLITPVDVKLQPGQVAETVTVEAKGAQINTESGELSSNIPTVEITELPIFNLNAISLALTLPGVVDVDSFSNGVGFSVNGSRPRANNFLLDGQDINDNSIQGQALQPVNLEAVQDVTVLTNSYTAEYGRGGGSVTNVIYKSGTNKFHGSAWELYEGSGLNAVKAEDGLGGQTGRTKPRFDQHTYGFTFGGPAWKDKLFFFGTSQWQRFYGKASPATLRLPTAAGVATLQSIGSNANVDLLLQYIGTLRGVGSPTTVNIGARPGCAAPCSVEFGLT